jgi:hypothetical protein
MITVSTVTTVAVPAAMTVIVPAAMTVIVPAPTQSTTTAVTTVTLPAGRAQLRAKGQDDPQPDRGHPSACGRTTFGDFVEDLT